MVTVVVWATASVISGYLRVRPGETRRRCRLMVGGSAVKSTRRRPTDSDAIRHRGSLAHEPSGCVCLSVYRCMSLSPADDTPCYCRGGKTPLTPLLLGAGGWWQGSHVVAVAEVALRLLLAGWQGLLAVPPAHRPPPLAVIRSHRRPCQMPEMPPTNQPRQRGVCVYVSLSYSLSSHQCPVVFTEGGTPPLTPRQSGRSGG